MPPESAVDHWVRPSAVLTASSLPPRDPITSREPTTAPEAPSSGRASNIPCSWMAVRHRRWETLAGYSRCSTSVRLTAAPPQAPARAPPSASARARERLVERMGRGAGLLSFERRQAVVDLFPQRRGRGLFQDLVQQLLGVLAAPLLL